MTTHWPAVVSLLILVWSSPQQDYVAAAFSSAQIEGQVSADPLNEVSGLVAGRSNPNALWTHNDSGDSNRIFALNGRGALLATFHLLGASSEDYEDISAGPGPEPEIPYLFVADTGNNKAHSGSQRKQVAVYRFKEPKLDTPGEVRVLNNVDRLTLSYPDGPHDVETLMVDPEQGDLYLVSKRDERSRLYRAASPAAGDQQILLEALGELRIKACVAGDISPDGSVILLKNYKNVYVYQRAPGTNLVRCLLDTKPKRLPLYQKEPKGEALAFDHKGQGFYCLGESENKKWIPLYYYPRAEK